MTLDEKEVAQWVADTCLLFGSTPETAHKIAGLFAEALATVVKEPAK